MLQRYSLHSLSRQTAVFPLTLWWLAGLTWGVNLAETKAADPVAKYQQAVLIRFEGTILPFTEHVFYRHLELSLIHI